MNKKTISTETGATDAVGVADALGKTQEEAKLKSVSDLVGGGQFYPDLPKMPLTDIQDVTHELLDATILVGLESDFGPHDAALMLLQNCISGEQYTTISSGMVILKKIRELLKTRPFPILATIVKPGRYWDII